jgi:hypothetical protein
VCPHRSATAATATVSNAAATVSGAGATAAAISGTAASTRSLRGVMPLAAA